MLIDSHAHLDSSRFHKDLDEVLKRAQEYGVDKIINIGCNMESSKKTTSLSERYDQIWSVVGFHPHDAKEVKESDWDELDKLTDHPKVVGVGEMGLDYYRDLSPRKKQQEVFRRQIQVAKKKKMPIVVHDRDAHEEVFAVLKEEKAGENKGVMHCYSGDLEFAKKCMDMGFYISIAGPVTFKKTSRLKEVAKSIPNDRLLVETDCPYLAPEPYRGKRNEPAYVKYVAAKIAELRGMSYEEIVAATRENTCRLFKL